MNTPADPVAAARALHGDIVRLAPEGERARTLPAALVTELNQAGLFALLVPHEFGGGQAHPQAMVDAIAAVAEADASAAWCVMIAATTGVTAAYLPQDEARVIFTPGNIAGGVYAPIGRAEPAEAGYRVTGRWPFASGSGHCDWLLGGAMLPEGPPRLFFFPAAEVTIHDTWHTAGLRGTGSNDIEVVGVEVPAGRSVSIATDRPWNPAPLYKFPVFGLLALGIAAVALGNARGAIDDLLELAGAKTPTGSRRKLAERPVVQADIARAEADLRSARAFVVETVAAGWDAATAGEITQRLRAELRLAATSAVAASARVADAMYTHGGGTAIYESSPLQRRWRDAHAATQHMMVAGPTYELAGRVLLGLEVDSSGL